MLSRWAVTARLWLVSGGYLVLLIPGLYQASPASWRLSLGATALMALWAWTLALQRLRTLSDTPLSAINSASQGYVALRGQGLQFDGFPVFAPHRGTPCLWFRYRTEHRSDRKWTSRSLDESSTSFILDDGTGRCTIDPDGAEMLVRHREVWTEGDERYTLELLLPGETLQVLGEFRTQGGESADLNPRRDTGELLAHWKKDMPDLVRRYDRNADGVVDVQEWEQVRRDARHEVDLLHRDIRAQSHTHNMGRCSAGRPYIISARDAVATLWRLRAWAWLHAVVFLLAFGLGLSAPENWPG